MPIPRSSFANLSSNLIGEWIEEEVAATRAALASVERRVNLVTWVVTLEGIAVAILALLLLLR